MFKQSLRLGGFSKINFRKGFFPFKTNSHQNHFVSTSASFKHQKNKYYVASSATIITIIALSLMTNAKCDESKPKEDNEFVMPYRLLGNTGMFASVLSYGFWYVQLCKNIY